MHDDISNAMQWHNMAKLIAIIFAFAVATRISLLKVGLNLELSTLRLFLYLKYVSSKGRRDLRTCFYEALATSDLVDFRPTRNPEYLIPDLSKRNRQGPRTMSNEFEFRIVAPEQMFLTRYYSGTIKSICDLANLAERRIWYSQTLLGKRPVKRRKGKFDKGRMANMRGKAASMPSLVTKTHTQGWNMK
ncbi:hypothetical protein G7Y89_g3941 [Cudoniella acicularis]|uniref:Uncharacterized protein n=1 Tax=Cudoniella acicularis TaxID=354080 RepID=A0A8H4W4R1_9HELO|nr:hypothetical protein G7Y89_g3941 [Cudoniella acicularis]